MQEDNAATPARGVEKVKADWERVEAEFRAGMLSNCEISRLHGVSEGAIRKRAKRDGWERDLSAKVDAKVRAALVRGELRAARSDQRARTESEVVEEAVATKVHVVMATRGRSARALRIAEVLEAQLLEAIESRDEIETDIETATAGDANRNRESRMKRAIELPTHVATLKDLAAATATLVKVERQAFGLTEGEDAAPNQPDANADRKIEHARLDGLAEKLRAIVAARGS